MTNVTLLKSKLHRLTVTGADLNYEGSVTIDPVLMQVAHIVEYEQVHIWDVTNGNRIITYALKGEPNSGEIKVNGAGAHLIHVDDIVIIATFHTMDATHVRFHKPTIVLMKDSNNTSFDVTSEQGA